MEPLEVIRDASPIDPLMSRPPSPAPRTRRPAPRRLSSHVYPPDWVQWMKHSPGSRRFSFRKQSLGRTSTKSNDDVEATGAQTHLVPEFDATSGIPLRTLSAPGSPTTPVSPSASAPTSPARRHSNAWHFIHSFVSHDAVSSPSASTDSSSQPPSSPPVSDTPLLAMPPQAGQGSPVAATTALPGGEIIAVPEPFPPTITESPAPPSAHDAVVNKLLRPPIVHRSNSTPVPEHGFGTDIHRTLSGTSSPNPPNMPERVRGASEGEIFRNAPLATMLRAPLDASGGGVTRALGSHIEAVLSAQVEIGRAHLALEGIGAAKPARLNLVASPAVEGEDSAERAAEAAEADEADLLRRQQGVEDLMAKLSELATTIKAYHAIGTPALIFPPTLPHHSAAPTKPRLARVTIANPDQARNESLPTSADSMPVPELRKPFPPSSASTRLQSPMSPTSPPAPPSTSAASGTSRRGVQMWFRKNEAIPDSPVEMSASEQRKRPW